MKNINVLIAGIGGQGINTLTKMIHVLCEVQGWHCVSAVYKGGAQRLGSVHAEIRLFSSEMKDYQNLSSQIIPGTLDLLIGFELWETLRYSQYFHSKTIILADDFEEFPNAKENRSKIFIPVKEQLNSLKLQVIIDDFRKQSITETNNIKNTNMLMLKKSIQLGILPLDETQINHFISPLTQNHF